MTPQPEDSVDKEVLRLMEVLKTLARLLGFTNRDIERMTDINHATMSRYLAGKGEPRLDFLLRVVRALGMEPAEFFDFAYAERSPQLTSSARRLRRLLTGLNPPARPVAPAVNEDEEEAAVPLRRREIEEMVEDLRREIREQLGRQPKARKPAPRKSKLSP